MREAKIIDVSQIQLIKPILKPRVLEIISFISQGGAVPIVKLSPIPGKVGQYRPLNRRSIDICVAHRLMGLPMLVARFSKSLRRDIH